MENVTASKLDQFLAACVAKKVQYEVVNYSNRASIIVNLTGRKKYYFTRFIYNGAEDIVLSSVTSSNPNQRYRIYKMVENKLGIDLLN